MAEGESMRDVLARMLDDADHVNDTLAQLGPLEDQEPSVLLETLGSASLVVRAAGMVAVSCGDALARIASAVAVATD